MVNLNTAVFHHFLKLAVTDRIRHVPADTPQDDVPFKMAAFKLDCQPRILRSPPPASIHQATTGLNFATEPKILRYTAIQDVGQAIHPSYVEGQMQGGVVQGIGWALSEEYVYDQDGRLVGAICNFMLLARTDRPRELVPATLELRNIVTHPTHDGGVSHRSAALGHHLDQVSEAEPEAQVPPHAQDDNFAIKVRPSNSSSTPGSPAIAPP